VSYVARSPAFETYRSAAYRAYERSDNAAAAALFTEALSELDVLDPSWPRAWLSCVAAQVRAEDPIAAMEAAAGGVALMFGAAPLDVPPASVIPWLEAAFFALTIPGIRDAAATVLAPLAIPFAAEGRRHLSILAARSLDLIATSLLEQGETEKAAVLDARLRRISPARAQRINLDLRAVRARYAVETAGLGLR
jgi:hypothetical protein